MKPDNLYNMDCVAGMSRIEEGSIDLAFADPPFNIGYKYDVYEDKLAAEEYLAWTKKWGEALLRTLKPTGTFWLAIGDDFAAELKLLFQRELGLFCRSWIVWFFPQFHVNSARIRSFSTSARLAVSVEVSIAICILFSSITFEYLFGQFTIPFSGWFEI